MNTMILREVRRFLRSAPLLTLSGIAVLGIGIGATALALSLLIASSSLVFPGMRHNGYATVTEETEGGGSVPISWRRFEKLRISSGRLAKVAAYSTPIDTTLGIGGATRPMKVAAISSGFFSDFASPLSAGRDFNSSEEEVTTSHSVILSKASAMTLFGIPSNALGHYVMIGGEPYQTVGVASDRFTGVLGDSVEAWVPAHCIIPLKIQVPSEITTNSDIWKEIAGFYGLAASNRFSSTVLTEHMTHLLPLRNADEGSLHVSQGLTRDPMRDATSRKWFRLGLLLSFAFSILTSLNFALLLLSRMPRYLEEVRLKKALGAGLGRLLMELLAGPAAMIAMSLIVAGIVWTCGLKMIYMLPGFYGDLVRGSWQAGLQAFVVQLPFACALTLLVALLPAVGLLRDNGAPNSGRSNISSRCSGILLQLPVIAQIAFCGCIWILAGMLISASLAVIRAPLGYDPTHLTSIELAPRSETVSYTNDGTNSFPTYSSMREILEQVSAIPGVRSASFSSNAPFHGERGTVTLQRSDEASGPSRAAYRISVSPDYFKTMGTRVTQGRPVAWHGTLSTQNEIVINETLERELWQGENPIDHQVRIIYPAFAGMESFSVPATVVGVAEDMRLTGPSDSPAPTFFDSMTNIGNFSVNSCLIVNGTVPRLRLQAFMDTQVARSVPELKVWSSSSAWDDLQDSLKTDKQRCYFALAGALIMGGLACIGLCSSLAYYVGTKRRELAVRICLGAKQQEIRNIILWRAVRCATIAIAVSIPLWPAFVGLASSEYLGRASWSTGRAMILSLACVIAALFAALIPANAAANVSPAEILKEQ